MHSIGGAGSVPRGGPLRSLYLLILAAVIAAIAAAITLALWLENEAKLSLVPATGSESSCGQESWPYVDLRCRGWSAENGRRIRLISTDRIDKTSIDTVAAPVPAPAAMAAPVETVETSPVAAQPAAADTGAVAQPSFAPAEPIEPGARRKTREVSPRARAEVRPRIRIRNGEGEPAPALGMTREKSYTGAGNRFDAVH